MNNKGMIQVVGAIFVVILIIVGLVLGIGITGNPIIKYNHTNDPIPYEVSGLSLLNLNSVENFESYKQFADNLNGLISILNDKTKTKIPELKKTKDAWDKASKTINKYAPLINNYNDVIYSSKNFSLSPTKDKYNQFYQDVGIFSLEITFISATLFHTATFNSVGTFYRASGLNTFAFKCPSCISAMLSTSYWIIKTVLVE
ncbi:MAG: hypothetical protein KKI14_01240, partial [Nanoarchaeota archaeon]|nr:hypothetical protein [Nanoarchaeota archaeon]